jgi:hypothetical protein
MEKHGYLSAGKTYLVSYPRSGANWLRYCIEAIWGAPTHGVAPHKPLTLLDGTVEEATRELLNASIGVDLEKGVVLQHSHRWHVSTPTTRILMIVRNYKECIIRDFRGTTGDDAHVHDITRHNSLDILCNDDGIGDYSHLLETYVKHPGPKHIVYFEDLKVNPGETLAQLAPFMKGELEMVATFMEHIDRHNKVSVLVYNNGVAKSYTQGSNNLSLHSDEFLTVEDKIKWDEYIKEHHPTIVSLLERYFEK